MPMTEEDEKEEEEAEEEEEGEEEEGEAEEGEDSDDESDDEEERPFFGALSGRLVSQVLLVFIGVILGVALTEPQRFSVAFIARRGAAVDEVLPPSPPRTVPFDEDEDYDDEEAGEDELDDEYAEMHADWMREQGWEQHIDPASGKPFYYHAPSQVSQWERPTTSPASPMEAGEDELPAGWHSATDPDTGRPYFWSDSDRETTTWAHPGRKPLKAGWEEHCCMAKVSSWLAAALGPWLAATRRHPAQPSWSCRKTLGDLLAPTPPPLTNQALGRRREALLLLLARKRTVKLGASQLERSHAFSRLVSASFIYYLLTYLLPIFRCPGPVPEFPDHL